MNVRISTYARRLMELVTQEDLIDVCYKDLKEINDEINSDEELLKFITSADKSIDEKKARLQEIFENDLDEAVLHAFFLVVEQIPRKHMEAELIHEFLSYYYRTRGIVFGAAYSARKIAEGDLLILEDAFSKKLAQRIKLENKVDPSLLGGVKVIINDTVWDGTYRSKINDLRSALLNVELDENSSDLGLDLENEVKEYKLDPIRTDSNQTTGYVTSIADGVANISGIYQAMAGELLNIGETKAMVMDLEEDNIAAVLLGNDKDIVKGTQVSSTGKVVEVPVGDELLGRVVDALGRPIDGKGVIKTTETRQIEVAAPGVIDRSPVNEPLQTGIKIIDSMIPIGKGQRELIIGDRQTGKTAIAIDTIINQRGRNVKCIYVAIGQKNSTVAQIIEKLNSYGSMAYTTVVVAGASELASFVFYLHSRLLERSGKLSKRLGEGSLTALPIIETQAGDISAYIPTNVISITDGQIFLQTEMFNSGIRPAIDYGLSVSRVGSSAQIKAMKKASSSLKLDLSQYQEVLDFAQFGSDLDPSTRARINHGSHLVEMLKQPQYAPMSTADQIILLLAGKLNLLDEIPLNEIKEYEEELLKEMNSVHRDLMEEIETKKDIDEELMEKLTSTITVFTTRFKLIE